MSSKSFKEYKEKISKKSSKEAYNLIYMWIKQNKISKREFIELIKDVNELNESMISQKNLDQMRKVINQSKNTDIGYRTASDEKEMSNILYLRNGLENIESYEEWPKKTRNEFDPTWNVKGKAPKDI